MGVWAGGTEQRWEEPSVKEACAVMLRAHDLDLSPFDTGFLGRSLERRRQAVCAAAPESYLFRLAGDPAEAQALFGSLRVTFSAFFRDPLSFALLEQTCLPALLDGLPQEGREIRVWSAGCAAGQEAWSAAIALEEAIRRGGVARSYRVFATDVSEADLAAARAGVYAPATLGEVPLRRLETYFTRQGDSYAVAHAIRDRVEFFAYDLLDKRTTFPAESIYGDFDLVLCCNVLLYYRPAAQREILSKIRKSLAPNGFLMTGETDRPAVEREGFRAMPRPACIFQTPATRGDL